MNKKVGKINKGSERDKFTVVLEGVDSKLDLVIEGLETLDHRIDKVEDKLEDFRKEVDYKFEIVFDELHLIRNELKEKVGRDEFILLEKRVMALEKLKKQ